MNCQSLRYSRRELVEMAFGAAAAGVFTSTMGCERLARMVSEPLPSEGKLLSQDRRTGHRVRDLASLPHEAGTSATKHQCVIVGAGVAGLSAAWHASRRGLDDFVILELEQVPGGTSRSGSLDGFQFPWGAHYLPVPKPDNEPLIEFLHHCGVMQRTGNAAVEVAEHYLCRDPAERVFASGQWWSGLFPEAMATPADHNELVRFRNAMTQFSVQRGDDGRPMFVLPMRRGSFGSEARQLDQISMSSWMDTQRFTSPPLRWMVDYACRDDYGLRADQTSAWAGLFYFAARMSGSSDDSQPVMTWPSGNGFLIEKLTATLGDRLQLGQAVVRIAPKHPQDLSSTLIVNVLDSDTGVRSMIEAEHVILAVPQFVGMRMLDANWMKSIDQQRETPSDVFTYGSWMVANVHLRDRPRETNFPMSWDNVIMPSVSLGYVNATHQLGLDHGPTVLTWYQAFADDQPAAIRQQLVHRTWAEVAETVIMDLELAHADIRPLVTRLDAMLWGHAMPQPRVGSVFHPARLAAQLPIGNVHFACTDLSGIALFEEAFDHGRRAAFECQ